MGRVEAHQGHGQAVREINGWRFFVPLCSPCSLPHMKNLLTLIDVLLSLRSPSPTVPLSLFCSHFF